LGKTGERIGGVGGKGVYASLNSFVHSDNITLKFDVINWKLPVLERKWSKIDESILSDKYIKAGEMRVLIKSGMRGKDISKTLSISPGAVSNMRKRMGVDKHGNPL
jgi:hypothetical protein